MPAWFGPVGRGLVLAVPLVLIFAVLFASADPIFNRGFEDLLAFRLDLGDLPGRIVFALAVAWLAGGLLSVAAKGLPAIETASLGAAARSAVVAARPGARHDRGDHRAGGRRPRRRRSSSASSSRTCSVGSTRSPRPA